MRKLLLPLVFAAGFVCAGGLSAGVVGAMTGTTTTATTSTTTTTTTPPPPPPPPSVIAPRVRISGVRVGGLTQEEAYAKVRGVFERPFTVLVARKRFRARPARLGAVAYAKSAVARALVAPAGTRIKLKIVVHTAPAKRFVARLAARFDRQARDAQLVLRNYRPVITGDRTGRTLDRAAAVRSLVRTLVHLDRKPVRLRLVVAPPAVSRSSFGPIIVIRRESKRLYLYNGMRLWRTFPVATGQSAYPTPLGRFQIVVKSRNPWWYPPNSTWAKGAKPIPPGPGNPLGTRWMGLSAPGVGIHGTPDPASIGYSASHGCIRMLIPQAEWLFEHVAVGTPVFIVGA